MNPWLRIAAPAVLAAFSACLLSSCAMTPGRSVSSKDAAQLPAAAIPLANALLKREKAFVSLRAQAYVNVETMNGRQSLTVALLLQHPRYMRIEFMTPGGLTTASFASDGRTYQFIDLDKQQFITEKLTGETLKERLGLVMEYIDLWQALAGQIPFPLQNLKRVETEGDRLHAIAESKTGYETRNIYNLTGNLPIEHIESDESGVDFSLLRLDDFQEAGEYILPRSLLFANSFAKMTMRYNEVIVNDLLSDDAFFLVPPWETQ